MESNKSNSESRVIITGATSLIGLYLLPELIKAGKTVSVVSRKPAPKNRINKSINISWHQLTLFSGECVPELPLADTLIHLAPLWVLPGFLEGFSVSGGKRLIAFSSTSRFTKITSNNPVERNIAEMLIKAEDDIISMCEKSGIAWTIFRPTLVYGSGSDKNISFIMHFIRRYGFFPLPGKGEGLRQPVHADDLATASVSVIDCKTAFNKSYNLTGGETLSYRDLVELIFSALGKKKRIIQIPVSILGLLVKILSCIPKYRYLNKEMLTRMEKDLCFDSSDAVRDFGYSAKSIREGIKALPNPEHNLKMNC